MLGGEFLGAQAAFFTTGTDGDDLRTKGGGGPNMTVDGYTSTGEVICTYWIKNKRQQEHFVEATLELVSPPQGPVWSNPKLPRF